mgnify:FL=1|tara:strand:+ start:1683 stop:2171 length:489 start_codon:yes stop_codon:yes gene_type:complete
MKQMNNITKKFKKLNNEHLFLLIGSVALLGALHKYSNSKLTDGHISRPSEYPTPTSSILGSVPTSNASFQQPNNASTSSDLLPSDSNSQWGALNPQGSGNLQNVNLLHAGAMSGINTVGNSLRNPNLQIRADPPNPKMNVGPWQNSTIEHDPTYTFGLKLNC